LSIIIITLLNYLLSLINSALAFPHSHLDSFDFVLVHEYMEESLVLLHLKATTLALEDILCFQSSKVSDKYTDAALKHAFVPGKLRLDLDITHDKEKCFAQSARIERQNLLDKALYNEALARFFDTVDGIGRGAFDDLMSLFYLLRAVSEG